jgi:hypothetical protein
MLFVYLHMAAFAAWMLWAQRSPWPTLTLVVSLEAIFLSALVMVGQNRQAAFQRLKADHDFVAQEQELHTKHGADPHHRDPHRRGPLPHRPEPVPRVAAHWPPCVVLRRRDSPLGSAAMGGQHLVVQACFGVKGSRHRQPSRGQLAGEGREAVQQRLLRGSGSDRSTGAGSRLLDECPRDLEVSDQSGHVSGAAKRNHHAARPTD